MNASIVNRFVKQQMDKLLLEDTNTEVLEFLREAFFKSGRDYGTKCLSDYLDEELTATEVDELRVCLLKKINKTLKKEKSFVVTTKLLLVAVEILDGNPKTITKRQRFCWKFIFHCSMEKTTEYETILKDISLMDE